jgi:hypothetical protein
MTLKYSYDYENAETVAYGSDFISYDMMNEWENGETTSKPPADCCTT